MVYVITIHNTVKNSAKCSLLFSLISNYVLSSNERDHACVYACAHVNGCARVCVGRGGRADPMKGFSITFFLGNLGCREREIHTV